MLILVGALTGGLIPAVGWFVINYLAKRKEYEFHHRNVLLKHLERQVEEFYGPLLGLIQESSAIFEVTKQLLPMCDDLSYDFSKFNEDDYDKYDYFTETYFLPNNAKKAALLNTKLTLLEKGELPESFQQFLQHQTQYECIHNLMKQGIKYKINNASQYAIRDYPVDVEINVRDCLNRCKNEYYDLLNSMTSG